MLTNTAVQQRSSETEERQNSSSRNILTGKGHLCFGQLHPRHNLQILEQLWTKECCKQGLEVSPVDTTELETKATISYTVELQEMLCSHGPQCHHPGIVIINKHIHLPSFLRLLAPMHSYGLDFSNAKSWNKADREKLGQQLKWLPKRNLFAQAKAVLSPNMGVVILQPFAWKTMKEGRTDWETTACHGKRREQSLCPDFFALQGKFYKADNR